MFWAASAWRARISAIAFACMGSPINPGISALTANRSCSLPAGTFHLPNHCIHHQTRTRLGEGWSWYRAKHSMNPGHSLRTYLSLVHIEPFCDKIATTEPDDSHTLHANNSTVNCCLTPWRRIGNRRRHLLQNSRESKP